MNTKKDTFGSLEHHRVQSECLLSESTNHDFDTVE